MTTETLNNDGCKIDERDVRRQKIRRRFPARTNYWSFLDPQEIYPLPKYVPLPYLLESKLIGLAQQGDVDARNTICMNHARLVLSVVNGFRVPVQILPDIIQEGMIGLLRAITLFQVRQYCAFSTYAWYWIRAGIFRYLMKHRYSVRVPAHHYAEYCRFRHYLRNGGDPICQDEINRLRDWRWNDYVRYIDFTRIHDAEPLLQDGEEIACNFDIEPDSAVERLELREVVASITSCLDARSALIVRLRYGLDDDSPHTLQQIGRQTQLTHERIRQILHNAKKRLRRRARQILKQHKNSLLLEYFSDLTPDDDLTDTPNEP